MLKIAGSPPIPIATFRAGLPPGIEAVVARCLEKDRQKRYANVADLARAIVDFAPARASGSVDRVLRTLQTAGIGVAGETRAAPTGRGVEGPTASVSRTAPAAATLDAWGQTGTETARAHPSVGRFVTIGAAALLGAGLVGALMWSARPKAGASPEVAPSTAVAPLPTSEPRPSASAAVPATSASSDVHAEPAPTASASTDRPAASPTPHPAASHASRTTPAPAATPTRAATPAPAPPKNCNPPYVIDSNGHRQYKPECL